MADSSAERLMDLRNPRSERGDSVARALRLADLLQMGDSRIAAFDTGRDAIRRQRHALDDSVEQRERAALAVDLAQQIQSTCHLVDRDLAVERDPGPRQEGQILQWITGPRHVPVDHRDEMTALDDPVVRPRVVVADDLVGLELDLAGLSPDTRAVGPEVVDRVMEVAEPLPGLLEHGVEHDLVVDRDAAAFQVGQDLAPLVVHAFDLGDATQPARSQMAEKLVDGRGPRPGGTPHRAPDPGRATDSAPVEGMFIGSSGLISWHAVIVAHDDDDFSDVTDPGADETTSPPQVVPARPPRPINRPAWELPPTTEPVTDPPPPPDVQPADTPEWSIDDDTLPAGGWFRRRGEPELDDVDAVVLEEAQDDLVDHDDVSTTRPAAPVIDPPATEEPPPADPVVASVPHPPMPEPPEPPLTEPVAGPPTDSARGDAEPALGASHGASGWIVTALTTLTALAAAAALAWWRPDAMPSFYTDGSSDTAAADRRVPLGAALLVLLLVFAAAARWRGVRAVLAVGVSIAMLVLVMLPEIRDGHPPIGVAGAAAALLVVVLGHLVHGFGREITAAVFGTLVGLAATAGLGYLTADLFEVTAADGDLNPAQLAAAAAVIAVVGLLLDLTTRQVRITSELRRADPSAPGGTIQWRALRAGGDLAASNLLTLTFVFLGAGLVALVAAAGRSQDVTDLLTSEVLATELARVTVCGLAGLVALPVASVLADRFAVQDTRR